MYPDVRRIRPGDPRWKARCPRWSKSSESSARTAVTSGWLGLEITSQQLDILYIFIVSFSDLIIVSYICIFYMYLIYVSFICIFYVSYSDLAQFSQFKTLIFAINGYQSGNSTCFLGGSVSQGFNFCRVSKIFHVLDYAPADRGGNPFWFPQKHNFEIGGFPIATVISWRISVGNF